MHEVKLRGVKNEKNIAGVPVCMHADGGHIALSITQRNYLHCTQVLT